jgi:hypothetical protein
MFERGDASAFAGIKHIWEGVDAATRTQGVSTKPRRPLMHLRKRNIAEPAETPAGPQANGFR